tara:strand:- start:861 stop:3377 length:2517 start_codon:yes stop_codon:yes gene_type:complete
MRLREDANGFVLVLDGKDGNTMSLGRLQEKFTFLKLMGMNPREQKNKMQRSYSEDIDKLVAEDKLEDQDISELGYLMKDWLKELAEGNKLPQQAYVDSLVIDLKKAKVKINGQPIVSDHLFSIISTDHLTYIAVERDSAEEIEEKLATAIERKYLENQEVVIANVKRIISKMKELKGSAPKGKGELRHFTGIINQQTIALLTNTPSYSLDERENIYSFWKKVHESHGKLIKIGQSLIKELQTSSQFKNKQDKETVKEFKEIIEAVEKNNYVVLLDEVKVIDTTVEEQAMQILTAFMNRKEEGSLGKVKITSNKNYKGEKYDILTALYVDSVLGGAFYDGDEKKIEELQDALSTFDMVFTGDNEKYKKEFNKLTDGLSAINPIIGHIKETELDDLDKLSEERALIAANTYKAGGHYVPATILSMEYLRKNYPTLDTSTYINLNKSRPYQQLYKDLFNVCARLVTIGSSGRGGSVRGKANMPQFPKDKRPKTYSQTFVGTETEFKDLKDTSKFPSSKGNKDFEDLPEFHLIGDKIFSFITELRNYLITPMITPKVGLGIDFDFTQTMAYDIITSLTTSSDLLEGLNSKDSVELNVSLNIATRAMLMKKYGSEGGGAGMFSDTSLNAIKEFLEELNKPFQFVLLQQKAVKLIAAIQKTMTTRLSGFDDKVYNQIKNNMESEIHSFIDAISIKINRDKNAPFNRTDIPLTDIENLQDIFSFQILKDFLVINKDDLKANRDNIDTIIQLINTIKTSDILSMKLLSAHDGLRLIKGMPIHYGFKSLYSLEGVSNMVDELSLNHGIDITAMDIAKAVETIDSYESIGKDIGISEEGVYIIKANFR